jgi:signal transduction histidine kinase
MPLTSKTRNDALRIFEPFVTTTPNGLEVGLALSRSIVEAHGGRLWATANSDVGTTFHFTLPSSNGRGKNHA